MNYHYTLYNTYVFPWESDFFAIAKQTGYVIEVEVKVSKQDFKADFNKTHRFNDTKKHDLLIDKNKFHKPHKFAFACPEGLISTSEIPKEYGLMYVIEEPRDRYIYRKLKVIQQPKFLHKQNLFKENWFLTQLLHKYYYRTIDLRNALNIREIDIKYGQKTIRDKYDY
jgi:hypothetical protein